MFRRPILSVVVVVSSLSATVRRTLQSLSPTYQNGVSSRKYDVHVVALPGAAAIDARFVRSFGSNYYCHPLPNGESVETAFHYGALQARTGHVVIVRDDSQLLTPGVLERCCRAVHAFACPVIAVRRMIVRTELQASCDECDASEVLTQINWPAEPYRIFEVAQFAGPRSTDWFSRCETAGCIVLPVELYQDLPDIVAPRGVLNDGELLRSAVKNPRARACVLLGEATFQQISQRQQRRPERDAGDGVRLAETDRSESCLVSSQLAEQLTFVGTLHPHSFLV